MAPRRPLLRWPRSAHGLARGAPVKEISAGARSGRERVGGVGKMDLTMEYLGSWGAKT